MTSINKINAIVLYDETLQKHQITNSNKCIWKFNANRKTQKLNDKENFSNK